MFMHGGLTKVVLFSLLQMECPVCLEPYGLQRHRPKALPCGHSVCLDCLQNSGFGRQCPQDRKVSTHYIGLPRL